MYALHLWPVAKRVARTISIDMPLRTPRLVTTPMLNAFSILEWHPGGELYPIRLNDRPRAASELYLIHI